jgi:hypothetical protein
MAAKGIGSPTAPTLEGHAVPNELKIHQPRFVERVAAQTPAIVNWWKGVSSQELENLNQRVKTLIQGTDAAATIAAIQELGKAALDINQDLNILEKKKRQPISTMAQNTLLAIADNVAASTGVQALVNRASELIEVRDFLFSSREATILRLQQGAANLTSSKDACALLVDQMFQIAKETLPLRDALVRQFLQDITPQEETSEKQLKTTNDPQKKFLMRRAFMAAQTFHGSGNFIALPKVQRQFQTILLDPTLTPIEKNIKLEESVRAWKKSLEQLEKEEKRVFEDAEIVSGRHLATLDAFNVRSVDSATLKLYSLPFAELIALRCKLDEAALREIGKEEFEALESEFKKVQEAIQLILETPLEPEQSSVYTNGKDVIKPGKETAAYDRLRYETVKELAIGQRKPLKEEIVKQNRELTTVFKQVTDKFLKDTQDKESVADRTSMQAKMDAIKTPYETLKTEVEARIGKKPEKLDENELSTLKTTLCGEGNANSFEARFKAIASKKQEFLKLLDQKMVSDIKASWTTLDAEILELARSLDVMQDALTAKGYVTGLLSRPITYTLAKARGYCTHNMRWWYYGSDAIKDGAKAEKL